MSLDDSLPPCVHHAQVLLFPAMKPEDNKAKDVAAVGVETLSIA